jgi:PAS domain S-box-containing protein
MNHTLTDRMTRLIIWGVLAIGLMLTLSATWNIKVNIERLEELEFRTSCNTLQRMIATRLDHQARILWSGAALFSASETVTREEWHRFTQQLRLENELPGIQGFGFAVLIPREKLVQHTQEIRNEGFPEYQVRPEGDRELYSSIIYLEPFSGRNLRAFGYDMFSELVRRAAMERARDTDAAALSGKVILVQETDREVQFGALMYVPVYRNNSPTTTLEERRAAIRGWVYSPYRMNDLLLGILGEHNSNFKKGLCLSIFDGDKIAPESCLFAVSSGCDKLALEGQLEKRLRIEYNGHGWTLLFRQVKSSFVSLTYAGAWVILGGGGVCTLLVCLLLRVLLNTRRKAQQLADQMTADLQQSKEALLRTTERLSLAVRAGGIGIWDLDVVHNRLDCDEQMFRLYGLTPGQSNNVFEAWKRCLHPEDRLRMEESIQLALKGEREFDVEFRILWPDGTVRYLRGFASVLRDATGKALHMIGTNWDMTETKCSEDSIKRQSSLITALLDSMPDIIFFKDLEGRYLGCNPNFLTFVGVTKEELLGKTDYELFAQPIAEAFRANDRRVLQLQEPRFNEEWITYPDGTVILCNTLKTPYWGPDGELVGILGIGRDITAHHRAEIALRESEANFRTFFETMTDMLLVATPEGQILLSNATLSQTLGYTSDELFTMCVPQLHPAEMRQEAEEIMAAMLRGERESCPLPLMHKDGSQVPVETRIWLGYWNGVKCLFGVSKNLTEEREANQRFERLFRNNPCPINLSILPDRRLIDVNDAFLKTFGFTREEVIGQSAESLNLLVKEEQREALSENLLAEGRLVNVEVQFRRKDGSLLDGLVFGEVFNNKGQQFLLAVMTDITERKQAERELDRLSVIQRALMELATEFVNVPLERQDAAINESLETMGRLIHADRAYLFSYNFEAGVMSNTHEWCKEGISPEIGKLRSVPPELFGDWVSLHQRGECIRIHSMDALPPESEFWQILAPQGIQSLISIPLLRDGVCFGFVGFDAVQQERIWKEEEIALLQVLAELYEHFESRRSMERETQELQKRLTEARDAAQEAARTKSLFLANMSHEIRTPLNAILGYAQIMGRECVARACPMSKKLVSITRSGEHLLELLNDLLELVRSDTKEVRIATGLFDFYQALEDVRLIFVKHPAAQMLTLQVSYTPEVPRFICSDSGKVRQVLVNLLSNAIKFTERGGVRLSASLLPDSASETLTLAVDVEDTGCGIRPEEQEHLFELFYTHTERGGKAPKGTGLGLPLCQRYARALGGDVALIRSVPGEGSCFRFTFQIREADPAALEQRHKGVVRGLAPNQPPFRVLVVDDDPANREMLVDLLEPLGITVETDASAINALHHLSQSVVFDLVLMDKRMPEMDGYEAIRLLREMPGGEKIIVLVVSASGDGDEREAALAAGANGYVSKPVHRDKLLEEIRCVTGLQYEYEPQELIIPQENLVLDDESFSHVPVEMCRLLGQALQRGDIQQLRDLVETLERDHAALASGISVLVDAYDYDRLLQLIEARGGSKNER